VADSKLAWHWRRLRAMGPVEILDRARVKIRQRADRKGPPDFSSLPIEVADFPKLPNKADVPAALREALAHGTKEILAGSWKFFGHLPLQVDTPPKWQFDYLVRKDFQTSKSAFDLDHRTQADGADIKVIWEPSRWSQLTRLAMCAYVLNDKAAARACVDWLSDWRKNNPAFTGLNWTSALETGLRLIHFSWIDALLSGANFEKDRLAQLRQTLLPHHFWYTSRYLSFGSSANNHLLGELAGLAVALARFPALASLRPDMDQLHRAYEREALLQFAPDGGNREQALSYHLFSWELAWHAQNAIASAGYIISKEVRERLLKAGHFYANVKMPNDPFEYGDSDNAAVLPCEINLEKHAEEFRAWFIDPKSSPGLNYWQPSNVKNSLAQNWTHFQSSNYAILRKQTWLARLDASELGYLDLAAHGHLDALHLSLWKNEAPIVIDPGTGAYYANKKLREHLASWPAHNGPHLSGKTDFPKRYGTFLWGRPHAKPLLNVSNETASAEIEINGCMLRRHVRFDGNSWEIRDETKLLTGEADPASLGEMRVHWRFAPATRLEKISDTQFRLDAPAGPIRIELQHWKIAKWSNPDPKDYDCICSPAFRAIQHGPILHLQESLDSLDACVTRFTADDPRPFHPSSA
jgi:hypothetical protein